MNYVHYADVTLSQSRHTWLLPASSSPALLRSLLLGCVPNISALYHLLHNSLPFAFRLAFPFHIALRVGLNHYRP